MMKFLIGTSMLIGGNEERSGKERDSVFTVTSRAVWGGRPFSSGCDAFCRRETKVSTKDLSKS